MFNGVQRVYDGIAAGTYTSCNAVGADLEARSPHSDSQAGPHNMGHDVLCTPPNHDPRYFVMVAPEVA